MARKTSNDAKIYREISTLKDIVEALPPNPIPWAAVVRLVAPVVARLAVRLVLKKTKRSLSEDKVNTIASAVADTIATIVKTRTAVDG